jgi:hypothetical protein
VAACTKENFAGQCALLGLASVVEPDIEMASSSCFLGLGERLALALRKKGWIGGGLS